jgi:alkanesulfonate monooxygenase SsuD/methylene tetrahydromethanopterin reductase-like flavin-dependent oxidoreductase (luciferase family)
MLPLAARYADVWHAFGSTADLARKAALLDRFAAAADRDPAEIGRSTNLSISEPWDQVRRQAGELRKIGFDHLIASWPEDGQPRVEEFVEEIMPELVAD